MEERNTLEACPPQLSASAKQRRRSFSADDKARILAEATTCNRGELSALMKREGVHSSQLSNWRRQAARGAAAALTPAKRGPKAVCDERDRIIAELRRRLSRMTKRAEHAEARLEFLQRFAESIARGDDGRRSPVSMVVPTQQRK